MDLNLLEEMLTFHAVVSNEEPLAQWLVEQLRPHATRVERDRVGNVYAWRGDAPQVAICGHMDSVGFIVEEVWEDHVKVIGMGNPAPLPYQPMVIESESGMVSGVLVKPDDDTSLIDLWEAGVGERVQVGDLAAFAPNFRVEEGRIHSRWLDNKLGTWVALEAWKASENAIFVATVREEHGPNGAAAVTGMLPELRLAIVVDITFSVSPRGPYIIEWGKGPAVTFRDANLYDRRWAQAMLRVAREHDIPAQAEVATGGGSDADAIMAAGVPAIFVGVPIRYAHTPAEVARLSDAEHAHTLLTRFLERYGEGELEGV